MQIRFPPSTPAKVKGVGTTKSTPQTVESPNKKHTCKQCKRNLNETADKLLICGKCEQWSCRTCAKLTVAEYDVITKKASKVHWFCIDCDGEAMAAVKASQLFTVYTEEVNRRLDTIESNLTSKANCSTVADLYKRVDALSVQVEDLGRKPDSSSTRADTN